MASSSGATKVCFNSSCNQPLKVSKQGWLCRTGNFAELCDRCASAFENGKFCDTYHVHASGWRCCESCGKQIHCGCIVSFHTFVLLDAGGIECLKCAKTEYILTPNPTWPSVSHFLHRPAERISDVYSRSWRTIAGSGPVPWRQATSLFNAFNGQPELQVTSCSLSQSTRHDPSERFLNDNWRVSAQEVIGDKAGPGIQYDGKHSLFKDGSCQSFFHTNATPLSTLPATFVLHNQKIETGNVSGIHVKQLCAPSSPVKQCSNNNGVGPSIGNQAHNTKAQGETRAHDQLLPRYWPRLANQELQQLPAGSNAKITPLFEKVLSPTDAGRICRLVLPKKCAEVYLPPISKPEGCPLVIQDLKGKDWVLHYRFWNHNHSRIYVLEGVTPCIRSMQLQAGDIVTFSRLEPEGKLVMGFRKASLASQSDKQGNETTSTRISAHEEPLKDGPWSEVGKTSIHAKRKKGAKMYSNSKNLQVSVTLEQVQGLLRPPLTNAPTIVLIEGVEFEVFQEAPIVGSPTASTDNVGSLCSTEAEPTPKHLDHMLPMINQEDPESVKTMEMLDAFADLTVHDGKATTRHPCHKPGCNCIVCVHPPPNGTNYKSPCTCNVSLTLNHRTPPPMMHHGLTHPEQQVGSSFQNPTQMLYADAIRYTQMGNINENNHAARGQIFENYPGRQQSSNFTFKNQNIDLNIQPEREEESYPVPDLGLMRLVQESTQRYIKQQKLSINGISHKIHD